MITENYARVLMHRVKKEAVPSYEKLRKLSPTQSEFVKEHAKRAIKKYMELIATNKKPHKNKPI